MVITSLADKNSNNGNTKCLSKYWPLREVKSNFDIVIFKFLTRKMEP